LPEQLDFLAHLGADGAQMIKLQALQAGL